MRQLLDNRYRVIEALGSGGMAGVWLARDEVLGRDVALKVLREQYADDEEFVERFRREAKNAASLNHPNIVQVYDQGRSENGAYYMAMEYVPGGTLKERIKREGPLDPGEAAGIASRVAEALAVAHARGIVHRDIKPQNVLLSASGEAKVADFGIARAVSSRTMTETNLVLGTAGYMSPEQVRAERVGPASDLYSLGVVLHEMLTAKLPYTGDDPIATAVKHLDEPPRHPREANPAVPEALDTMTAKLLAKKPEERYSSASELAEDLRRVSEGLPPLAIGLGEQRTAKISQDTGKTRVAPTVFASERGPGPPASRGRQWVLVVPLVALVVGMVLLSVLTWALGGNASKQDTPGGGGAQKVEVPAVVGLARGETQKSIEQAGLRLGSREEAPSDEVAAGKVIEQHPAASTEVDRGTAVRVVISTGTPREPAPRASSSATSSASPSASPASASPAAKNAGGKPQGAPQNHGGPPPWSNAGGKSEGEGRGHGGPPGG